MDVRVGGANGITTKALIDTGSPRCVFPRGVGDLVGLTFPTYPSDAPNLIHLMGRPWPAITATVQLALDPLDVEWEAEADFVMEEGLPFGLLGYEGFLNRWAVSFNGAMGYFVIEAAEELHAQQRTWVIDELRQRFPALFPDDT